MAHWYYLVGEKKKKRAVYLDGRVIGGITDQRNRINLLIEWGKG